MKNRHIMLAMLLMICFALFHGRGSDSFAQGEVTPEVTPEVTDPVTITPPTETPTPTPSNTPTPTPAPITVTSSEPTNMTSGSEVNLTIFGTNFTDDTIVRLVGYGVIPTTRINDGVLQAITPNNLNPATYTIEVSDPVRGIVISPNTLRIDGRPQPTVPPTNVPPPTNTPLPPTPIPGAPQLVVRDYRINPQPVRAGSEALVTVTLFNQGVRTAEGVFAEIQGGSAFLPSSSQASIVIPNIVPGQQTQFTIPVRVASDAAAGTSAIGLEVNYRDFQGTNYSTSASLTGEVEDLVRVSELTITRYDINPNPLQPGREANLTVVVTNTGSSRAQQAILRVPVGSGVLLGGRQGNNFALGDFPPGFSFTITLPLFVDSEAPPGINSQLITFEYVADGAPQTSEVNLTLSVDTPLSSSILLDSYSIGKEQVQPGERFTLDAVLTNVGGLEVEEAFVSFTLAPTSNSGGTTNTTNNNNFAPIGGGGTQFLGAIPSDENGVRFQQDFIVNGNVDSGVYNLPIVVRYRKQDGTTDELVLNASVLVVVPPRLRFVEQTNIPDSVIEGLTFDISLSLLNLGQQDVSLITASILTDNAEVLGEDEFLLQTLRPNDEQVIDATIIALEEGVASARVEVLYLNALNQEETFVQEYQVAVLPEPTPFPTQLPVTREPILETREPMPEPEIAMPEDFWGRLLLGLLGLGR